MNILLVDDAKNNTDILSLLVKRWFENSSIGINTLHLHEAYNGLEAFMKVQNSSIDLIFLDIMMPIMNGLDALQSIRNLNINKQPIIVIVTALEDEQSISKAKELKANAYITKPITVKMINAILDRYAKKPTNESKEVVSDDINFFDFDDTQSSTPIDNTHKKVSAIEFASKFNDVEIDLREIEDIDDILHKAIYNLEDVSYLDAYKENVMLSLDNLKTFLNTFSEFYDLYMTLDNLIKLLEEESFPSTSSSHFLVEMIIAIISDLIEWINHVFILKDTDDIYYMNTLLSNSYINFQQIIKKYN